MIEVVLSSSIATPHCHHTTLPPHHTSTTPHFHHTTPHCHHTTTTTMYHTTATTPHTTVGGGRDEGAGDVSEYAEGHAPHPPPHDAFHHQLPLRSSPPPLHSFCLLFQSLSFCFIYLIFFNNIFVFVVYFIFLNYFNIFFSLISYLRPLCRLTIIFDGKRFLINFSVLLNSR